MQKGSLKILLILFLCMSLVSTVLAQQTGSITGRTIDEEGVPLPGVTVTASSPNLIGTKSFVSTGSGSYRFPTLSPGIYAVTSELAGFKKVTQTGIVISVGKTSTVNVIMEPSAIEEEITVIARAPIVDAKSTKVAVTYTRALIENIPMARSLNPIIQAAPGVVGAYHEATGSSSVHGSSVSMNLYSVDGADTTDPQVQGNLVNLSPALYEEVEVVLGAYPASVGSVGGAFVNIVTRSGGNDFHGQAGLYMFTEGMVDRNINEDSADAFGLGEPTADLYQTDIELVVGGPVIRDKLWFFGAGRLFKSARALGGFPEDITSDTKSGFLKLTWQATKNVKLMTYGNYEYRYQPWSGAHRYKTPEACGDSKQWKPLINAQLNWVLGQNAFLDLRFFRVLRHWGNFQKEGTTHRNTDQGTGWTEGSENESIDRFRGDYQYGSSFTYFLDNVLGGNHEVKLGWDYLFAPTKVDSYANEPIATNTWWGSPYSYDNRGSFTIWPRSTEPDDGFALQETIRHAFYIQDNWTIADRLTINAGLRYTTCSGNLPPQYAERVEYWIWLDPVWFDQIPYDPYYDLMKFTSWSPRIGATFDVFGNGRTIAKASFGKYYDHVRGAWYYWANPNGGSRAYYNWVDDNWDGQIDPSDTFILNSRSGRIPADYDVSEQFDDGLRTPYTEEFIVSIDQEVTKDFRLSATFITKFNADIFLRRERNADKNWSQKYYFTDPGYDGEFGTSDDSDGWLWDMYKPYYELGDRGFYYETLSKDRVYRKYRALEFAFEKRMANRWQLFGSLVFSKMHGTQPGDFQATQGDWQQTPNKLINGYGLLDFDRPVVGKIQATYMGPFGINVSGYYRYYSGMTYTRRISVYVPNADSNVRINAEPRGTRRESSQNTFDLRLQKDITFGRLGRMDIFLDIYNAFNIPYIYIMRIQYGDVKYDHGSINRDGEFRVYDNWQKIMGSSYPRKLRLGIRFTF